VAILNFIRERESIFKVADYLATFVWFIGHGLMPRR
jgi:hypothetical protein